MRFAKKTAAILLCLMAALAASPAPRVGVITTVAGSSSQNGDGGPATAAKMTPYWLARAPNGDLFIADNTYPSAIRKVSAASGAISTIAGGEGATDFQNEGVPATTAAIVGARDIAVDVSGNVFYVEYSRHRVRRIDTAGIVTTVAGTGSGGFGGDGGPAVSAQLREPYGVAVDTDGSLLIGDGGNNRVRRVANGVITTVAGNGSSGATGEGVPATATAIFAPTAVLPIPGGGFYVGTAAGPIYRVAVGGILTRIAGASTGTGGSRDGRPAVDVTILGVKALLLDGAGNLFVSELYNVLKIRPDGILNIVAGVGFPNGVDGDGGSALAADLTPSGLALDAGGNLLIASNTRVRRVDSAGIITTAMGLRAFAEYTGDGGPATNAFIASVMGAVPGPGGRLLVSQGGVGIVGSGLGRVRSVDSSGIITTIAGGIDQPGAFPPAPATNIYIRSANAALVDGAGNLLVAASPGGILKVDPSGIATRPTLAFPAGITFFSFMTAMVMDGGGNLLVADLGLNRVFKVTPSWTVTVVAGTGSPSHGGDGGPASTATLAPYGLALDASGILYVSDVRNHRVRRIDGSGLISTIAGNGSPGYFGDGYGATEALLNGPRGIAADAGGTLYIADSANHVVRAVTPDGVISTFAGHGVALTTGDGEVSTSAAIRDPVAVAIDAAGDVLITHGSTLSLDETRVATSPGGGRVRKVLLSGSPITFAFPPKTGVNTSNVVQSDTVTPSGYTGTSPISITLEGEYSIGCNGTFTSASGTIQAGQSVCVRHTAAAVGNKDTVTTLTIGGSRAAFVSTTALFNGSFTLSAASFDFGVQSKNMTTPSKALEVTNTGSVPIQINAVVVSPQYGMTTSCGVVSAGEKCVIQVTFTPRETGAIPGSLQVKASSGTGVVTLTGFGERTLTTHYYQSILRRPPDAQGHDFWNAEAVRVVQHGANLNETWFALATGFFFSPEYAILNRDNTGFLTDMYVTFFNRAPDAGGLQFWLDQMAAGVPRESVLASFTFSPEFTFITGTIFGATAARAEVDVIMDFYRGIHSRLPDDGGIDFWVTRIRAAQCASPPSSRAAAIRAEVDSISSQFLNSPEYLARNRTNAQYVADLYNAFHRRGADTPGLQFWVNKLATGAYTREIERTGFLLSPEFQQRVNRVIAQGCLQ